MGREKYQRLPGLHGYGPEPARCAYLGVTTDYLLCGTEQEKNRPAVTDDDIKFALFGGGGEITDAMYEEVKQFAAFVRQREAGKKE